MAYKQETDFRDDEAAKAKAFLGGLGKVVVALTLFVAFVSSWVTIPQGSVGVVFDRARGGVLPQTLHEGWHWRVPFTQKITSYPVSLRTYSDIGAGEGSNPNNAMLDLGSDQGQHIEQAISIVYNVEPDKAAKVFDEFQGADIQDIEASYIRRAVVSAANAVAGKYDVMDIMGPKKEQVQQEILTKLRADLEPAGFYVDRVNLGQSVPPDSIKTALETKVAAQQKAETAQYDLQRAQTEAKAKIATAQGEAQANALVLQKLTPEFIRYQALQVQTKAIDKWDGKLPEYSLGSATPLISLPTQDK